MAVDKSVLGKEGSQNRRDRDIVLRTLYVMSCLLSIFQVVWFNDRQRLVWRLSIGQISESALPALENTLSAANQFPATGTLLNMSSGGAQFFNRAFITKYHKQTFVGVMHILAAPFWAAIIPLQLHPGIRKNFRRCHRILGTIFFALSTSLMLGLAAIMMKGLQVQPGALWARDLEGQQQGALPWVLSNFFKINDITVFITAVWFSYTLVRAWAAAFRRRFGEHEEWVLRHIASGQWVSLLRIIDGTILLPNLVPRYGDTQLMQSSTFGLAGFLAFIVCATAAEIAVARVKARRLMPARRAVTQITEVKKEI